MTCLRKFTLAVKIIHPQHTHFVDILCKKWFCMISLYLAPDSLVSPKLPSLHGMQMSCWPLYTIFNVTCMIVFSSFIKLSNSLVTFDLFLCYYRYMCTIKYNGCHLASSTVSIPPFSPPSAPNTMPPARLIVLCVYVMLPHTNRLSHPK